jgi:hypothetical protein
MSARDYVGFDLKVADKEIDGLNAELPTLSATTKNLKKLYLAAKKAEDQVKQALCAAEKKRDGLAALLSGGVFSGSDYDPEELTSESLDCCDYFVTVNVLVTISSYGYHRIELNEPFDGIAARIIGAFPGAVVWFTEAELTRVIQEDEYLDGLSYDPENEGYIDTSVKVKLYHFTLVPAHGKDKHDEPLAKRPKYNAWSV